MRSGYNALALAETARKLQRMGIAALSPLPGTRRRWPVWLAIFLVFWVYSALAVLTIQDPSLSQESDTEPYYNKQAEAFLAGHLNLDMPVTRKLSTLKDPYNPAANFSVRNKEGVHDMSYYKGKFYLYFGVTPVLVLYLPFKLLTGESLPLCVAGSLFMFVGFLASCAVLMKFRKDYVSGLPEGMEAFLILCLGLMNWCPILAVRLQIYEVAIASGFCFLSLSVCLLFFQEDDERGSLIRLCLAGLCFGLALGSRPNLLFAGLPLLWLSAYPFRRQSGSLSLRLRLRRALCFALPAGVLLVGLLVYNQLRFENPLEFGQAYQLAGTQVRGLSFVAPSLFWDNIRLYGFSLPGIQPYFPYFSHVESVSSVIGPGYIASAHEGMVGAFVLSPLLLLVPVVFLVCLAFHRRSKLQVPVVFLFLVSFTCFIFLSVAVGGAARYYLDFLPFLTLAVMLLLLAGSPVYLGVGSARKVGLFVVLGLGVYSISAPLLYACAYGQELSMSSPYVFQALQIPLSWPGELYDRASNKQFGEFHAELCFPTKRDHGREVLLVAEVIPPEGRCEQIGIGVEYLPAEQARLTIFVDKHTKYVSRSFPLHEGEVRHLAIRFGSLLPYYGHPAWGKLAGPAAAARRNEIIVALDGQGMLYSNAFSCEPKDLHPPCGRSISRVSFYDDFSGKVLWQSWADMLADEKK